MPRLYDPQNSPETNLKKLAANSYPGRLAAQGYAGGIAVQVCALMGRGFDSRNRIYVEQDGIVSTEVFDKSRPADKPELTIYDAMRRVNGLHVVSNGRQTNTIIEYLRAGRTIKEALESHTYEPDSDCTPRITGFIDLDYAKGEMKPSGISVIRKVAVSDLPVRDFFPNVPNNSDELALRPSCLWTVHTYRGDGKPLPSFNEAPFALPVRDTAEEMAQLLWDNLNTENRVAVAAKMFTPGTQEIHIINGHHQ